MAYLRSEKEKLEIEYPLDAVWAAVPEVVKILEWKIEEQNDQTHHVKIKTKAGFLAYSSTVYVDITVTDEKTTQMAVSAETPVTTITSVADFGRTADRLDQFITVLAKYLEKKHPSTT
jgi:hypothetical protein